MYKSYEFEYRYRVVKTQLINKKFIMKLNLILYQISLKIMISLGSILEVRELLKNQEKVVAAGKESTPHSTKN